MPQVLSRGPLAYLFSAALAAGALVGCDDYLDVNDDPNNALTPPLDGVLAVATLNTGLNQFRVADAYAAFFTQYLASPNQAASTDIYEETDYSGTWASLYGAMTDAYDVIRLAEERQANDHLGIARAVMAVNLGLVVDSWGDAPYSGAFDGQTVTPAYDDAEALYDEIFALLDGAREAFADSSLVVIDAGSDFIHGGDTDAWRRTVRALEARYRLHLSETGAYDPAAVLAAVDEAYTSNADDAQVTTFEQRNPWADVALGNDNLILDGWLSEQFVDALNGTTYGTFDPRLPLLTDTTDAGDYVGTVNGAGRRGDGTTAEESYLELDGALSSEDSPLPIITYAEVKFIEAEAALDAGDRDRALGAFREGIRASMAKIGVDDTAAAAFIDDAYGDLDADDLSEDEIFREKYIALFLSPETWVDARRYDYAYADFELPVGAVTDDFIRRVAYPATEETRNRGNVPVESDLTARLFWDQ